MRGLLAALLMVAVSPAWAQTPAEWRYIYSRQETDAVLREKAEQPRYNKMDGVISQPQYMNAAFHAEYDQWRRGLEAQLHAIVGPVALPPGFARKGRLNADLCCYRRWHVLDGLSFLNKDEAIVVTTPGLLRQWLKATPDFEPTTANPSDDPNFYQWTGASDWAVQKVHDLGNGAFLASGGPESDPHWIALTVAKDQRIFIAFVRAKTHDPAGEARSLAAALERQ